MYDYRFYGSKARTGNVYKADDGTFSVHHFMKRCKGGWWLDSLREVDSVRHLGGAGTMRMMLANRIRLTSSEYSENWGRERTVGILKRDRDDHTCLERRHIKLCRLNVGLSCWRVLLLVVLLLPL